MAMFKREIVIMFMFALTIFFPMVKSQTFDSFWFVQQWPPAVCSFYPGRCVGQGLTSFTIHGVWPQKTGTSVINCPGTPFAFSKISHLQNVLNKVWPNVVTGYNQPFWSHEWDKHGICSESKFVEATYFQMAINMRNNIDLLHVLTVNGLAPNNRPKSKQIVERAIIAHFKMAPVLRCKRKIGGQVLLVEIVMCFDGDGITLIHCNSARSNCANSFIF